MEIELQTLEGPKVNTHADTLKSKHEKYKFGKPLA